MIEFIYKPNNIFYKNHFKLIDSFIKNIDSMYFYFEIYLKKNQVIAEAKESIARRQRTV